MLMVLLRSTMEKLRVDSGEMILLVKYLLQKHRDLSSDPLAHVVIHNRNPSEGDGDRQSPAAH